MIIVLKRFVIDTSIIIDGYLSKIIGDKLNNCEIIIPYAVLDELQAQASNNRETGFIGLEEIKRVREIGKNYNITIRFVGERPHLEDIKLAKHGRIDAIIKDLANVEGATLITADYVQSLVAEAEGIESIYIKEESYREGYIFERYFDEETISIHLKEDTIPLAKKGKPGEFKLVKLGYTKISKEELKKIVKEISEVGVIDGRGSVEISRNGATVIQLENYRIAITKPPFSDGVEVTIVRPIVKLALTDYKISPKLMLRLKSKAEGILIAGPPGSGKSTLASSLGEFYLNEGKIVKTFESPRDLQVSDEITQYIPLEGSFEKAADILLLVRPDYTIFDEIRRTKDFEVFGDMRLSGVGMIGVVHASSPLDAIQRFMGRIELGMIPHIIDTIIFVKDGTIKKVYELVLTIKVPTGMTEEDLARPIVEVRDFENGILEYEIYTFGEENVVMPIIDEIDNKKILEEHIKEFIKDFDKDAEVNIVRRDKAIVRVERNAIPLLIGKGGSTIKEIEKALKIHIDVEPRLRSLGKEVSYNISEAGNSLNLLFDEKIIGSQVDIYIDNEFLFSAMVSKHAKIKVSKNSVTGKRLVDAILSGKSIKVLST